MEGTILVTYKILCKSDFNFEVQLEDLLQNEKIVKILKSEYAKGQRNIEVNTKTPQSKIKIETTKELYQFEVSKNDFADLLCLAEEDAKQRKLFKKECEGIELVDIETIT
ncbi:MAG TPA: hypothetical protein ENK66_04560 [Arcobacter sp.]|jgi:CRISPR/Cas system CSM-associated protein Csm4 (group 5 of RAMP superfamily)|nr:hypothetical protein [Arcobacter sp.]